VPGVIARKPIHLLTDEERKVVPKMKDLWIDIGSSDKADAESVVRVGDPVTFELRFQPLRGNRACSVAMDDKIGLWVVLEAFRRASQAGPLPCALYVASTVQEEIGLRGAQTSSYGVDPHVAIAVDVTHATDCPTIDKKSEGDIGLGKGPVVYRGPNMKPRHPDPARGQRPGHAHRRQRLADDAGRRGDGPGERAQPLHAFGRGDDLARRRRPGRRPARRLRPRPRRRHQLGPLTPSSRGRVNPTRVDVSSSPKRRVHPAPAAPAKTARPPSPPKRRGRFCSR
jgi:hypothetical protein